VTCSQAAISPLRLDHSWGARWRRQDHPPAPEPGSPLRAGFARSGVGEARPEGSSQQTMGALSRIVQISRWL